MIAALSASLFLSVSSMPNPNWAYDLYSICKDDKNEAKKLQCVSYFMGVIETHYLYTQINKYNRLYCPGIELQYGQMIMIFQNYANDHPEDLSQASPGVILLALKQVFPCKRER
jgi:hypothetical protein